MTPALLAALGEPNRFRIVELLGVAPRSVGEIALRLGLRQPQVTKHLQALERAGLVTMHPLGQRRIYALRRDALREVAAWAEGFGAGHPSEDVLVRYQAAIEAERALAAASEASPAPTGVRRPRRFRIRRDVAAAPERTWSAWTSEHEVRRWWSPDHFEVVDATVSAVVGGPLRIVMGEADGSAYPAAGRFLALDRPHDLTFELAPLDASGRPLFEAVHRVHLRKRGRETRVEIDISVANARPEAAPALAGIELGWAQTLGKLAAHLADDPPSPAL
jgi:uncharacterized protein YndB with AHSA1/START domain